MFKSLLLSTLISLSFNAYATEPEPAIITFSECDETPPEDRYRCDITFARLANDMWFFNDIAYVDKPLEVDYIIKVIKKDDGYTFFYERIE